MIDKPLVQASKNNFHSKMRRSGFGAKLNVIKSQV